MKEVYVNVAILGAGTAGLSAYRAAKKHTDEVILIEGGPHGTTCARVGCMPSKLLIAAAEAAHAVQEAPLFGVHPPGPAAIHGKQVMQRVRDERDRFVGFVLESVEGFPEEHKLAGYAHFLDNHRIQVDDHTIVHAKTTIIATGSQPMIPPPFRALDDKLIINDDVFSWQDLPESVVVFGPGVIGLELGQALHRLGVRVRIFGRGGRLGPFTDPDLVSYAQKAFSEEFYLDPDANVSAMRVEQDQVAIEFTGLDGKTHQELFDYALAATGRIPNLANLGLENTDLELDEKGIPLYDTFTMQCGNSNIFIAGDNNNHRPLLHEAADEGRIAGDNAGRFPDLRAGTRRAPMAVVFSEPQIATVGVPYASLPEECFATGEVSFEDQGRSRVMLKNKGLLHVYAEHGTGFFMGAEMIGPRAEHLAHLLAWAFQQNLTVKQMLDMPFYHPVIEEGLRTALRDVNNKLHLGPIPVKRCLDCGPGA